MILFNVGRLVHRQTLTGNLHLDLTAMCDHTRSIAPDRIALGIKGPRKPFHHDKVANPGEHRNKIKHTHPQNPVNCNEHF